MNRLRGTHRGRHQVLIGAPDPSLTSVAGMLAVTELVDHFYATVMAMGGERQDTSALIRHLPEVGE